MSNKIVKNEKQDVREGKEMNDCDYLNCILMLEKNMAKDYATALTEISNDETYSDLTKVFKDVIDCQRDLFNLTFKKGWYELEEADEDKIEKKYNEFDKKLKDLE